MAEIYARHSNSMTNSSQERYILHDSTSWFVPSTSLIRIYKMFLSYRMDKAAFTSLTICLYCYKNTQVLTCSDLIKIKMSPQIRL